MTPPEVVLDGAYGELAGAVAALARAPGWSGPVLVGISGAVGVGKSTTAELVAGHLRALDLAVEVVATDGFLLPNGVLDERGLTMRKGFPESFDDRLLTDVLTRLRAGEPDVTVPRYSHETYDRMAGPGRVLQPADVVLVEGVNSLQPPVVDRLDLAIYLDADEEHLRTWFVERFLLLCADAERDDNGTSFYRAFSAMDEAHRRGLAEATWEHINGVNLRDHIAPSRRAATHVVHKAADHSVSTLTAGHS